MSSSQRCHCARTPSMTVLACTTRSSNHSTAATGSSLLPIGNLGWLTNTVKASHKASLLRKDNSMLMRSMPSVYSPMRSKGITTSSLILNALVWRLIAAVRLRSSQNFLRASGLMATKPSPLRLLAMRTTSEAARATASASSPTISPINTIFGKPTPPRLLLVA